MWRTIKKKLTGFIEAAPCEGLNTIIEIHSHPVDNYKTRIIQKFKYKGAFRSDGEMEGRRSLITILLMPIKELALSKSKLLLRKISFEISN